MELRKRGREGEKKKGKSKKKENTKKHDGIVNERSSSARRKAGRRSAVQRHRVLGRFATGTKNKLQNQRELTVLKMKQAGRK